MKALLLAACGLMLAAVPATAADGWMTDWAAAKAESKTSEKPILLLLTGSDWCTWCIKLEKSVFETATFRDFAKDHLVLMEADYPRKSEQPAELKTQNKQLKKDYLAGGYPTVWLLDAEGRKLSEDLGEFGHDPEAWVKKLRELIAESQKTETATR